MEISDYKVDNISLN